MIRKIAANVLAFIAAVAVICVLGTADAVDQGAIGHLQSLWQSLLFGSIAAAFGFAAWVVYRRK